MKRRIAVLLVFGFAAMLPTAPSLAPSLAADGEPAHRDGSAATDTAKPTPPRTTNAAERRKVAAAKRLEARGTARGSSTPPEAPRQATDQRSSQRAVCQSQCTLQRMSCDQGRAGAFQNRSDQLQAAQSSCYLAVQACFSRC